MFFIVFIPRSSVQSRILLHLCRLVSFNLEPFLSLFSLYNITHFLNCLSHSPPPQKVPHFESIWFHMIRFKWNMLSGVLHKCCIRSVDHNRKLVMSISPIIGEIKFDDLVKVMSSDFPVSCPVPSTHLPDTPEDYSCCHRWSRRWF